MKRNAVEIIAGIVVLVILAIAAFLLVNNLTNKDNKTTENKPKTTITTKTTKTTKKTQTTKKKNTYTITYILDGGTNGENPDNYIEGSEIILKDAKKNGYTFIGWYLDQDFNTKVTRIDSNSKGNITLFAKFEIIYDYTITYHLDGGINNPNNPNGLMDGDEFDLLDPSKDDYTFVGWYSNEELTHPVYTLYSGIDYDIYAKFEIIKYDITYYNVTGLSNHNPETYTHLDDNITLLNVSKDGNTFNGWYLTSTFDSDSLITVIDTQSRKNYELYAKFVEDDYTINYYLDGGINDSNNPATYTISSEFNLLNASKEGYAFKGWYSEQQFYNEIEAIHVGTTGTLNLYAKFEAINYDINYYLDGGINSSSNPLTYTINDEIDLLDASKEGYTFIGWYTESSFDNKVSKINLGTIGVINLYAKFEIIDYDINYTLNGGTNNPNNPLTYTINDEVTLLDASMEGYNFLGWYLDSDFHNKIEKINVGTTGEINLYARFDIATYSITYNLDGGINSTSNPLTYNINVEVTFLDAHKDGYTFVGWYTESTFDNKITKIDLGSTGDITLFAKFEIIDYAIIYNLNGGTNNTNNPSTYTINDVVTLLDASKAGYTFIGWFTEATFANKVEKINVGSAGDIELFAKFEEIDYTINYNLDGGINSSSNPLTYTVNDEITLYDALKDGYTFIGWYTESTFDNKVTKIEEGTTGTVNLYAKFEVIDYAINYELNGGTNNPNNPLTYTVNDEITLLDASKAGYTFIGWFKESTFATKVTKISEGTTGDIDLFAKFEVIDYDIIYNLDGGINSSSNPNTYTINDEITLFDAHKDGYTFIGWYKENTFDNKVTKIEIGTTDTVNLFAKFEVIDYTINYTLNGGTNNTNNPLTYTINDEITLLDPSKAGYTFIGWFKESTFATKVTKISEGTTGDIDLFAKFEVIDYDIIYNLDGGINSSSNPNSYNVTNEITLLDAHKDGYTFVGWYSEASFDNKITKIETGTTGEITLYAKFEVINYDIVYNLNGGTNNPNNPSTYTINDEITLLDASKTGYTFAGWYAESSFTNKVTKIETGTTDTVNLFAKFTIITYAINYELNGGTNNPNNPATYNVTNEITLLDASKNGYEFLGWYSEETFDNEITKIEVGTTGEITLYAKFEALTVDYKVNHYLEKLDGTFALDDTETLYGKTDSLTNAAYKTTYVGFNNQTDTITQQVISYDGSTTINLYYVRAIYEVKFIYSSGYDGYTEGDVLARVNVKYGATIVSYPNELIVFGYSYTLSDSFTNETIIYDNTEVYVTYESRELSIAFYNTVEVIPTITDIFEGDDITLPTTSKTGYNFLGWATSQGGAVVYEGSETIVMPATSLDLYAIWEIINYTITYNLDGGVNDSENPSTYTVTDLVVLKDATKAGYTFIGWFTEDSFDNEIETITLGSTGAINLFAKFEITNYTITYNLNGGTNNVNNPSTYTINDEITLLDASKNGYTFAGWYAESTFDTEVTEITLGSTGDITLFAKFEVIDYTITYNLDGGTNSTHNPSTYTINDAFEFEDASKAGYTFAGWYAENTFDTEVTEITLGSTGNVVLYAKFEVINYTINYNLDGGTNNENNPATYTINDEITLLDATKEGYDFLGWYAESSFINIVTVIASGSTGTKNLFAKFEEKEYTITYNLNGGTNNANNPDTYTITDEITFLAATKTGYTFAGWYAESSFDTEVTEIALGSTGNVVLFAKFEVIEYAITYELNGGTNSVNNPDTYTVESAITFENASKVGYNFVGWYTESSFINKITNIALGTTGAKTLFAKFEIINYTINYNLDGGVNNANNPATYTVLQEVTLSDPSKTGYNFLGWYTDSSFETSFTKIEVGTTGTVNVFAKFEAINYTINYNLDGGTNNENNPATYTINDEITLLDATKEGYDFLGWYAESSFINIVTVIASGSTGTKNLFAKFEEKEYTITYNLNGGTNNANNPDTYTITDEITFLAATKTGYTFAGWYAESSFDTEVTEIALGSTGNVVLFAKFEVIEYAITYELNGGTNSVNNPSTYTVESAITFENATKTGYNFVGWYKESSFINKVTGIELRSTGAKTFYAKYELITYTITYITDGGTTTNPTSYNITSATITLTNASKAGYTFAGWYAESTFDTLVESIPTGSTGNKTLYAKFTIINYAITYNLNGGVNSANNPATYTINSAITFENATKTGYTFAGWYTDSGFATPITGITAGTTGAKTLYAKFTINTYTITYNLNGGVNSANNPASYNVLSAITFENATKTGYTFAGWYTDSGFTTPITGITAGTTGNKTLYAKFTINTYTITYHLNGGTNNPNNPNTYTVANVVDFLDATNGTLLFLGWYKDAEFANKVTSTANLAENLDLYARFSEELLYTITYVLNANDATNPNTASVFDNDDSDIVLQDLTRTSTAYTFVGWYTDSSLTHRILKIECSKLHDNITVYAKWNALSYKITYYDGSEIINSLEPTRYTIEDSFTLPTYDKFNYTFDGWYTDSGLTNSITSISAGTTGSLKLYAKTTDKGFTVKFYDQDKTTLISTVTTTTYGSVTAPTYSYNAGTYILKWVTATGDEADLSYIDDNYNLHVQLILISYSATVYYVDGDGYAKKNAGLTTPYITSKTVENLSFDDEIDLYRQMRVSNGSTYDLFYMSPVNTFDWSMVVHSISTNTVYTNTEGTMSCFVTIDGTAGTLYIIVYCIQPVAIMTSASQTLAFSQNLNMDASTYVFYKTIDEAFEAVSSSSGKLLRVYGRTNGLISSHCLTYVSNTIIASENLTFGDKTVARPKFTYLGSDNVLHNSYSILSSNILLPYSRSCTNTVGYYTTNNGDATSKDYVNALLVIDSSVTLTIGQAMTIGGEIQGGAAGTVVGHGVVMNEGTIIFNKNSSLACYGYLKGNGSVIINSGATMTEFFRVYDWPGGANARGLDGKSVFPIQCYSFHNVSCSTTIYSGATLEAWYQIYASAWATGKMILVGNGGLFQLTSGYIIKKVKDTTSTTNINNTYTVNNDDQISVKDVLEIHGNFNDHTVTVDFIVDITTGTNYAMPIGFMEIDFVEGTSQLSANSYKFLPGSSLIIGKDAQLTIASGVKVIFYDEYPDDYPYKSSSSADPVTGTANPYSYQNKHSAIYTNGLVKDGYHPLLLVDGSLIIKGNLGGKIYTSSTTGVINLSNVSAQLPKVSSLTYVSGGSSCSSTNVTVYASIYLYNSGSFSWTNASVGQYSSINHNDEFGWTQNVNVNSYTITFIANGSSTTSTVHTTESSYVLSEDDLHALSIEGYDYEGWFVDSSYTTSALGYTFSSNITLYAKLNPIVYSINYHIDILDDYDESYQLVNNNPTYFTLENSVTLHNATCGDLAFYGWFIDENYSISAPNITSSTFTYYKYLLDENNAINLYCYFSSITYYSVTYRDQEGNEIETIPGQMIVSGTTITLADAMPTYRDYDVDSSLYAFKEIVFSKWIVFNSTGTQLTTLNAGSTYTPATSIILIPYYVEGDLFVSITPATLSNASYSVKVDGIDVGSSSGVFYVAKGKSMVFTVTYTKGSNKSFTYTPASGTKTSGTGTSFTITSTYNATASASSDDGGCLLSTSEIMLYDGTIKLAQDITKDDLIVSYNIITGQFEASYISFNVISEYTLLEIIELTFENGKVLRFAKGHGMFNMDTNRYEIYYGSQFEEHIGETFATIDYVDGEFVIIGSKLISVGISYEYAQIYSPLTEYNINCVSDGVLTIPDDIEGMYDGFIFNDTLTIDINTFMDDINTYGVFEYEDVMNVIPEYVFNVFNFKYFKTFILKGILTVEQVNHWIETYIPTVIEQNNIDYDFDNREALSEYHLYL